MIRNKGSLLDVYYGLVIVTNPCNLANYLDLLFLRYQIRHSPSEPYLVRQASSPGPPTSSSPPVQHSSPTLPHLPRTESHSSYPGRSERPPMMRPSYARGPQSGLSDSDISYGSTSKPSPSSGPKISFLGTPKESIDHHVYNPEKLSDFISPYSLHTDRNGLDIGDFLPVGSAGRCIWLIEIGSTESNSIVVFFVLFVEIQ